MLTRLAGPAVEPVTLAEAKAHLAVIGAADDALLVRLIASAVAAFDGPEGKIGRCLISQQWRLDLADGFPVGNIRLPMPPVISVQSVKYRDFNSAEQTLSDFSVSGLGSADHATISPSTRWPSAKSVAVTFTAGFGDGADDVPEDVRNAILATVGAHYAWRESSVLAQSSLQSTPEIADSVDRWRVRGFG